MDVNVKSLEGNWDNGFSLDKHKIKSIYTGDNEYGHPTFDTLRTDAGEALYQLKYKSDFDQCNDIAQSIAENIVPRLPDISFIVAMPPSKTRAKQPVVEIANALSNLIDKPCINNIIFKSKTTPQMKDIENREDRIATLLDAFEIDLKVVEQWLPSTGYNVLIIDDLFDTGTSLEAATQKLRECDKIAGIFVATVTRTE
ncbi:TPA: ComF family protein [Vibrio vulnificus]|nr:ComF family protein [Vibrio vulnificus]HDY8169046.1 ComF family protein [Vibrio vulnificus]